MSSSSPTFKPTFVISEASSSSNNPPQPEQQHSSSWAFYIYVIVTIIVIIGFVSFAIYYFMYTKPSSSTMINEDGFNPIVEAKKIIQQLPNYITSPTYSDPLEFA